MTSVVVTFGTAACSDVGVGLSPQPAVADKRTPMASNSGTGHVERKRLCVRWSLPESPRRRRIFSAHRIPPHSHHLRIVLPRRSRSCEVLAEEVPLAKAALGGFMTSAIRTSDPCRDGPTEEPEMRYRNQNLDRRCQTSNKFMAISTRRAAAGNGAMPAPVASRSNRGRLRKERAASRSGRSPTPASWRSPAIPSPAPNQQTLTVNRRPGSAGRAESRGGAGFLDGRRGPRFARFGCEDGTCAG